MACVSPITCWYSQEVSEETGKRQITFDIKKAYVDMPLQLPCGKCLSCKADQSLMWSIRAYHESLDHDHNCFITLTYSDDHLPSDGAIDKRTLQLFFKRLRKAIAPTKLRYIACGEYGDLTRRPHYHALLFGVDFLDVRRVMVGDTTYTHPVLHDTWGLGNVLIGSMTMESICYTCGYVLKKMSDEDTFNLMSRRPGIGKAWLDRYHDDLVRTGKVVIEGREYAIPPRYLRWREDEFQQVMLDRRRYAKEKHNRFDPVERRQRSDSRQVNRRALVNQKGEML